MYRATFLYPTYCMHYIYALATSPNSRRCDVSNGTDYFLRYLTGCHVFISSALLSFCFGQPLPCASERGWTVGRRSRPWQHLFRAPNRTDSGTLGFAERHVYLSSASIVDFVSFVGSVFWDTPMRGSSARPPYTTRALGPLCRARGIKWWYVSGSPHQKAL